jgi:hypothetical protein
MRHQINKKKIFQMALFTLFSSLLFVGMLGISSAQAEVLEGKAKGKLFCDDGSAGIDKEKLKEIISIDVDVTQGQTDISGTITSARLGTLTGTGIGLGKNKNTGSFSFDAAGNGFVLNFIGKYVFNKKTGLLKVVSGKFTLMDFNFPCFGSGSFKAKFVSLSP